MVVVGVEGNDYVYVLVHVASLVALCMHFSTLLGIPTRFVSVWIG